MLGPQTTRLRVETLLNESEKISEIIKSRHAAAACVCFEAQTDENENSFLNDSDIQLLLLVHKAKRRFSDSQSMKPTYN
jgi:hypothetical protein